MAKLTSSSSSRHANSASRSSSSSSSPTLLPEVQRGECTVREGCLERFVSGRKAHSTTMIYSFAGEPSVFSSEGSHAPSLRSQDK